MLTIMRQHYTSTRMTKIKKTDHNRCCQEHRAIETLRILIAGIQNGTITLQKSLAVVHKILTPNSTPGIFTQEK